MAQVQIDEPERVAEWVIPFLRRQLEQVSAENPDRARSP